jgi:hypothetical protein
MVKNSIVSRRSTNRTAVRPLPHVVAADHVGGYVLHLTFQDGTEKTIDFKQWLNGPVFEPLRDVDYFRRFMIDGGTVAWPNGADVAPETLFEATSK